MKQVQTLKGLADIPHRVSMKTLLCVVSNSSKPKTGRTGKWGREREGGGRKEEVGEREGVRGLPTQPNFVTGSGGAEEPPPTMASHSPKVTLGGD